MLVHQSDQYLYPSSSHSQVTKVVNGVSWVLEGGWDFHERVEGKVQGERSPSRGPRRVEVPMARGGQKVWLKPRVGVPWEGRHIRRHSIHLKPTFLAALVSGSLVNSGNQGDSEKAGKEKRPGQSAKQLLLKYLRSTGGAGGITGASRGPWPGEGRTSKPESP